MFRDLYPYVVFMDGQPIHAVRRYIASNRLASQNHVVDSDDT